MGLPSVMSEQRRGEVAFFKWEFLRRNDSYREDWRNLYDCHRSVLRRSRYPGSGFDESGLDDDTRQALRTLHWKWTVGFMQDPDVFLPLWEMRRNRSRRRINPFWEDHEGGVVSQAEVVAPNTVRFNNLGVNLKWQRYWLPLLINLDVRAETLQGQIMEVVKREQKDPGRGKPSAPIRLDADSFERYLVAWEMRRAGHSEVDIAARLRFFTAEELKHPNFKPDFEQLRRVRRFVAFAKQFIASDYQRIS